MRLKEEQLRREEEKVCRCSRNHLLLDDEKLMRLTAPRDRAQGAEGDQREEAGAVGEGGVPQVCLFVLTLSRLADTGLGTWRVASLLRVHSSRCSYTTSYTLSPQPTLPGKSGSIPLGSIFLSWKSSLHPPLLE